jgi:hypothetical protein
VLTSRLTRRYEHWIDFKSLKTHSWPLTARRGSCVVVARCCLFSSNFFAGVWQSQGRHPLTFEGALPHTIEVKVADPTMPQPR